MTDPTLDWLRSEMEDARERCEAATEGPWKMGGEPEAWTPVAPDGTELVTCCCCGGFRGRRDVRFTVEARTDLPAALSVLDRIGTELARADMDTLFDALDQLEEACGPEVVEVLGELRDVALRREVDGEGGYVVERLGTEKGRWFP